MLASQYFRNIIVGETSAAFDIDTIEKKHERISSLISKYYKNSSILRNKIIETRVTCGRGPLVQGPMVGEGLTFERI